MTPTNYQDCRQGLCLFPGVTYPELANESFIAAAYGSTTAQEEYSWNADYRSAASGQGSGSVDEEFSLLLQESIDATAALRSHREYREYREQWRHVSSWAVNYDGRGVDEADEESAADAYDGPVGGGSDDEEPQGGGAAPPSSGPESSSDSDSVPSLESDPTGSESESTGSGSGSDADESEGASVAHAPESEADDEAPQPADWRPVADFANMSPDVISDSDDKTWVPRRPYRRGSPDPEVQRVLRSLGVSEVPTSVGDDFYDADYALPSIEVDTSDAGDARQQTEGSPSPTPPPQRPDDAVYIKEESVALPPGLLAASTRSSDAAAARFARYNSAEYNRSHFRRRHPEGSGMTGGGAAPATRKRNRDEADDKDNADNAQRPSPKRRRSDTAADAPRPSPKRRRSDAPAAVDDAPRPSPKRSRDAEDAEDAPRPSPKRRRFNVPADANDTQRPSPNRRRCSPVAATAAAVDESSDTDSDDAVRARRLETAERLRRHLARLMARRAREGMRRRRALGPLPVSEVRAHGWVA